jgi:predicted molibdopterin-dependent oxidoreductase YjgC
MTAARIRGVQQGSLKVTIDGVDVVALHGDTVAATLLVAGLEGVRRSRTGEARNPFCFMGVCQECLVEIDGVANRRACMHVVEQGMKIRTARDNV